MQPEDTFDPIERVTTQIGLLLFTAMYSNFPSISTEAGRVFSSMLVKIDSQHRNNENPESFTLEDDELSATATVEVSQDGTLGCVTIVFDKYRVWGYAGSPEDIKASAGLNQGDPWYM